MAYYSTALQLQTNLAFLAKTFSGTTTPTLTAFCEERIALADKVVKTDLANVIDFTLVNDTGETPATPDFINLLSQYKSAELSYVRAGSVKRKFDEVDDRMYWEREYNKLLGMVRSGMVKLVDSTGASVALGSVATFEAPERADTQPYFGEGQNGMAIDSETLEDYREGGLEP